MQKVVDPTLRSEEVTCWGCICTSAPLRHLQETAPHISSCHLSLVNLNSLLFFLFFLWIICDMWEPFGSPKPNATGEWRGGPNERGTFNILSTCLITLILCVWTALHLNIPEHGKNLIMHIAKRKTVWLIVGLFAPEFIVLIAFQQWLSAKQLDLDIKKIAEGTLPRKRTADREEGGGITNRSPDEGNAAPRPLSEWTKVHAHYVLMGGFAFSTHRLKLNILPNNITRAVLTREGLLHILKYHLDLIPDISVEAIEDKSKASALAKTLVCLQATWFVVETIGRLATRYPISLLEMNTLVHALCCLAVYVAWWDKPLDIEEPTLLLCNNERVESLCAWMVEGSDLYDLHEFEIMIIPRIIVHPPPAVPEDEVRSLPKIILHPPSETHGGKALMLPETVIHPPLAKPANDADAQETSEIASGFDDIEAQHPRNQEHVQRHYYRNTPNRERCKSLADLHAQNNMQHRPRGCVVTSISDLPLPSEPLTWSYARTRATSFMQSCWDEIYGPWLYSTPTFISRLQRPQVLFWLGAIAGGAFYGALHLIAWHGPFHTQAQRMLWRVSGLILVGPLLIILFVMLLVILRHAYKKVTRPLHRFPEEAFEIPIHEVDYKDYARHRMKSTPMKHVGHWIGGPVVKLCISLYAVVYFFARIYIVIESIINLAYLPDDVYKTPDWSNYMPHIGAS